MRSWIRLRSLKCFLRKANPMDVNGEEFPIGIFHCYVSLLVGNLIYLMKSPALRRLVFDLQPMGKPSV